MQLLISDSNILIDLIVVEQIENMFKLPYSFAVPDILFDEELKEEHPYLLEFGLNVMKLKGETVAYAFELAEIYTKPGRNDLFALALAKHKSFPIITGDADLRDAAESQAVVLFGTIWIIEQLIHNQFISVAEARILFEKMKEKKRRLPWILAQAHLDEIEQEK